MVEIYKNQKNYSFSNCFNNNSKQFNNKHSSNNPNNPILSAKQYQQHNHDGINQPNIIGCRGNNGNSN